MLCSLKVYSLRVAPQTAAANKSVWFHSPSHTAGWGSIAINRNCTTGAVVAEILNAVHIFPIDPSGMAGPATVYGKRKHERESLVSPHGICFVHRGAAETLLIADAGKSRVVEITTSGVFMREIKLGDGNVWV